MAVDDIYRLTFVQSVNDTRISSVFYYRQKDSSGSTDAKQRLGEGFDAGPAVAYAAALSTGWDALCYEISQVGLTGQAFYRYLSTKGPGTKGTATLNAAACCVLAFFTADGSYRGTGRTYISGFEESFEHNNNLNRDGIEALEPIADALRLDVTSSGVSFEIGRGPGRKLTDPGPPPVYETWDFSPWVEHDIRVPLTKLRSRRQSTRC